MKGTLVTIFLASLCAAVFAQFDSPEVRAQRLMECSSQAGTDAGSVKSYLSAMHLGQPAIVPQNFGCFIRCMLIKKNAMTEDGQLIFRDNFPSRDEMISCVNTIPATNDLCAKALEAHNCFVAVVPNAFERLANYE